MQSNKQGRESNHEGVDTNTILHVLDAPADSAAELSI